jgi:repressor LexA
MLTPRQHELLCFIDAEIQEKGIAPSYVEMKRAMGLASLAGINRIMKGLTERGFVHRLPNRTRAIEVLIRPNTGMRPSARPVRVPIMAGLIGDVPVWRSGEGRLLDVPPGILGRGDHFAFVVDGDSMVDEGLLGGDVAILRRADDVGSGRIALVSVDGRPLIRRWSREGSMIRLDPGSRAYDPTRHRIEDVTVHGVLAGMIRTYV